MKSHRLMFNRVVPFIGSATQRGGHSLALHLITPVCRLGGVRARPERPERGKGWHFDKFYQKKRERRRTRKRRMRRRRRSRRRRRRRSHFPERSLPFIPGNISWQPKTNFWDTSISGGLFSLPRLSLVRRFDPSVRTPVCSRVIVLSEWCVYMVKCPKKRRFLVCFRFLFFLIFQFARIFLRPFKIVYVKTIAFYVFASLLIL